MDTIRIAAARARSKFYTPAKPCPEGHTLRYTSTGACVDCAKRRAREQKDTIKALLAGTPA